MTPPVWTTLRFARRPSLSTILPDLLVGEYPTSDDLGWLHDAHGVTAIVNLQDHSDLQSKGLRATELAAVCRTIGMQWHHAPIPDGDFEALRRRLETLLPLLAGLAAAGERIYLHCNAGFNRAPTVAIAHLHVNGGLPFDEAVAAVTSRRTCAPYLDAI